MNHYGIAETATREKRIWPVVEACYSRSWEHYDMPPHYHNRVELMYVLKGQCQVHLFDYEINDDGQQIRVTRKWTEQLRANEFIFLDRGVLHELEVPDSSYMLNVEFGFLEDAAAPYSMGSLCAASPDLTAFVSRRQPVVRSVDESGELLKALEQIILEYSRPGASDRVLEGFMLAELLLRLSGIVKDNAIRMNARSYARRAADYMALHMGDNIRVADVAEEVGVAPAYLQRVFKQTTGATMVEYLNRMRVEQSKRLLTYTEDSILDIAMASGFNSRQHFFRVFQAETRMSPQAFRQEHRSRDVNQIYLFENVDDHSYDKNGNPVPPNDDRRR